MAEIFGRRTGGNKGKRDALRRVTGPDIPVPASPPLEQFYMPDAGQVIAAIKAIA